MKKIIYALCFIVSAICLPVTSGAQWMVQSESLSVALSQLNVLNDSTLFAATDDYGSYILKSTNSGVSWDTIHFQNAWNFEIQFLNDSVGFIGGIAAFITGPTYFKTLDGGQSWQPMTFYAGGGYSFHSLFFISKDTGFVGNIDGLYKTTNGGDSFHLVQLPNAVSILPDIYFKSRQDGFVVGWKVINSQTFEYFVFKTIDQGATWTTVYSATQTNDDRFGNAIYFSNQQNGFISGFSGFYLQSTDGGTTWQKIMTGGNKVISNFDFVNAETGYAVSDSMLLKTTDGGLTWQESPTPAGTDVMDVQFLNDQIGYVSGHKVCKTTTGTTGIIQKSITSKIDIFPNPAKNIINLQYNNLHIQSLTLTDLSGRVIKTFPAESKSLNVSGVAAGLYFLQVKAKEGTVAEKVEIR